MFWYLAFFFASLFWPVVIPVTRGFLVTDALVIIYLLHFLLRSALSGRLIFPSLRGLKVPILFFLSALLISIFNSGHPYGGFIAWVHHLFYFTFLALLVGDLEFSKLRRYLELYRDIGLIFSILSIMLFVIYKGQIRALGVSGFSLSELLLPALFLVVAEMIFEKISIKNILYTLIFTYALLTTQTRGPLISAILGIAILLVAVVVHYGRHPSSRIFVRYATAILLIGVFVFSFVVVLQGYSETFTHRIAEAVRGGGTVRLRLFLWDLAVKLFLDHPITGIGLAQFDYALEVTPFLKNIPIYFFLRGLSTHNLFLSYLVETGILGTLGLIWFFATAIIFGWRSFKNVQSSELVIGGVVFAFIGIVFLSSFFQGWWLMGRTAYEFMFFLACSVVLWRKNETEMVPALGK